jgi:hypothetical protein
MDLECAPVEAIRMTELTLFTLRVPPITDRHWSYGLK